MSKVDELQEKAYRAYDAYDNLNIKANNELFLTIQKETEALRLEIEEIKTSVQNRIEAKYSKPLKDLRRRHLMLSKKVEKAKLKESQNVF